MSERTFSALFLNVNSRAGGEQFTAAVQGLPWSASVAERTAAVEGLPS